MSETKPQKDEYKINEQTIKKAKYNGWQVRQTEFYTAHKPTLRLLQWEKVMLRTFREKPIGGRGFLTFCAHKTL